MTFAKKTFLCDLLELKEDAEMGSRSRHGSGASSSGETPKSINELKVTLENIYTSLREKRHEQKRPQEINVSFVSVGGSWYVLSCLWYDAYKGTIAANRKE